MKKPSKEEFGLVVEAIRYEYKNRPLNLETPTLLNTTETVAPQDYDFRNFLEEFKDYCFTEKARKFSEGFVMI